jgi:hypothetical protein
MNAGWRDLLAPIAAFAQRRGFLAGNDLRRGWTHFYNRI